MVAQLTEAERSTAARRWLEESFPARECATLLEVDEDGFTYDFLSGQITRRLWSSEQPLYWMFLAHSRIEEVSRGA